MSLDFTIKYQTKIAERFKKASLTNAAAGHDYDFTGARGVKVYTMNTAPLTDYGRGSTRYGSVTDLEFPTQEMLCTQAKSFTKHIEALDNADIAIDATAGKFLKMELAEVVVPAMDKYRLKKWAMEAATLKQMGSAPTKATIVGDIMALKGDMSDNLVPDTGLTLFISNPYYILLKQADAIVGIDDGGYNRKAIEKGIVGTFDGMKVVPVPSTYMPAGVYFIIKAPGTSADPVKLAKYDVIEKAVGYSGPVIQGLAYYDAFVIGTKNVGIGVAGSSAAVLNAPAATIASHKLAVTAVTGAKLRYTLDGSDPRWSETAVETAAGAAISNVTTVAGQTARVIAVKDGCVSLEGTATDA